MSLTAGDAFAETRKLKLYFLHTGERAEITYKKNGRYVQGGLKKINRFLRDWRRNEPTKMDPRLLDLIWEVYKETGSRKHIHVISAYRSPATNSLLRKRGRGVAKKSQHTLGKALDFFIPGVSLRKLRNIGLKKGLGGVGYYPKSGSPFVHMDTGRVRHWPRMSRKELARVFPKGKTLHVPTDGKPLARYNQAKAEYERKLKGGSKIVIAKAEEIEKKPSVFAKLLGRGEEEESQLGAVSAPRPVAVKTQKKPEPEPAPKPQPQQIVVEKPEAVEPREPDVRQVATPEIILASLPSNLLPVPRAAPRAAPEPVTPEPEVVEPPIAEPIVPDGTVPGAEVVVAEVPVPDSPVAGIARDDLNQAAPGLEGEPIDGGTDGQIELAYGLPQPAPRPQLSLIESVIANSEPVPSPLPEPQPEPVRVAALSPVEIEDLRAQIYASGVSQQDRPAPRPAEGVGSKPSTKIPQPAIAERSVLVASANAAETDNVLSLLPPQPNPRKKAFFAIEDRMAVLAPLEPGTNTRNRTAVPSIRPETKPEEIVVASLKPIEPGTVSTDATAYPTENPEREPTIAALISPSVSTENTASIPVPVRAERPTEVASIQPVAPSKRSSVESRLSSLAGSAPTKRRLGKWALSADTLITRIEDIRPPAYAKNVIRELPSSVLSQGFVANGASLTTSSFSGSSVEFLDFTRF